MKSIFIFRRDFRLEDNLGFIECYKKSSQILPIFIFTETQVEKNPYFSSNAFQFMLESLDQLDNDLKTNYKSQIQYYYGENVSILNQIKESEFDYDALFFNKDYTPYAQKRDEEISNFCKDHGITCIMIEDYLLSPMGTYLKTDGHEYQKYTPFKNNAKPIPVQKPIYMSYDISKFKKIKKDSGKDKPKHIYKLTELEQYYEINNDLAVHGGRDKALKILGSIRKFMHYSDERNDLNKSTTHLSAYIKFGCVSIREVYYAFLKELGIKSVLIDQLYWREFYYYLSYYNPYILEQGKSLKEKYDAISWGNNKKSIEAWKKGLTGFPGVDAGMRQMNKTGFMHNRARLITSGILIKILNCDWRVGEKYFAQNLIDYDPIVNNGNWQWSSGSGADSQPYFRILSPWKQIIDNDPDCEYIKKWIPELENVDKKDILKWDKKCGSGKPYPCPIVNYEEMRKDIIKVYKDGLYES
jgi:deoxyribodipyrimidine photo-lyase